MTYSSDKDLIYGCLAGRKDALEALVKHYSDPVYRFIQYTFGHYGLIFIKDGLKLGDYLFNITETRYGRKG